MPTTIAALTSSIQRLLGNRVDVPSLVPEQMGNAVRELSNNYPFEELRVTGPTVQFTPGQNDYPSSFFELPQGTNPFPFIFNKMVSWYYYLSAPQSFSGALGATSNPGYPLKFKDIENLEVLVNTLAIPMFWSQFGAQGADVANGAGPNTFYVAATPSQAYYTYARYQFLHPFTEPIAQSTDPIYLPSTWYDIIEYATCERIALQLRMADVADRFHVKLFGDPKHPGVPGLIAQRVSQTQKNQGRTTRSVKVQVGRY